MPGKLLPPAIAAKGFVDSAIPINVTATAALSGYGGAIAPAITALASATTSITTIQTTLSLATPPPISPPSRIGVNTTAAILAQITTVNATIAATTAQSVAAVGAPSPSFPASAALVGTQLLAISTAISVGLIVPQQI
jgi:hypothetical protein